MSSSKVIKTKPIKELYSIHKGKKCTLSDEPLLRYIQIDDLRNNNNIKFAFAETKNILCDEEDIIIAWDGANAGTIGYGLKGSIGSTLAKLKPLTTMIFSPYAGRFLQSKFNYLRSNCTGATIPHISKPSLINIQIPLPPLPEQQKIAAILDVADQLRQKDQQLIEKYTALSQSLFLELFGDPTANPYQWEIKNLSDVCFKITDGTHQSPTFITNGIPFLLVSNIVDNEINYQTNKFISKEEYEALTKNTSIEVGDILYTSVGSYGNPAIVKTKEKFCFQRHIAQMKLNHQLVNSSFINGLLQTKSIKEQADKLARGVAQKTLNLSAIKSFRIIHQ